MEEQAVESAETDEEKKKKKKKKESLQALSAILSTEKSERKGKQKKQQKLRGSEAHIALEDPQTDVTLEDPQTDEGKQLWEGPHALALTDMGQKNKEEKKKKRKSKVFEVEEEAISMESDRERKKKKLNVENTEAKSCSTKLSKQDSLSCVATVPIDPLELLKVIRNREISPNRKIQLAFDFVQTPHQHSSRLGQAGFFSENGLISPSHFVTSLSEWVQTQIVGASKTFASPRAMHAKEQDIETSLIKQTPAHLDKRYWTVFRWCLLLGMEWKSGFISLNIMQALSHVLDAASIVFARDGTLFSSVSETDLDSGTRSFASDFFLVLLDVVKLLFHVYEVSFRPKLDMWISFIRSSLKLASLVYACSDKSDVSTEGLKALFQLLVLVFRGFVRFLKSSPNPRKVFQAVVEKLLESLLTLFTGLSMKESGSHVAESKHLLSSIEGVLKHSLFHPLHIDGYANVCTVLQQAVEVCNDAIRTESTELCNVAATMESKELCKIGKATRASPALLSYHKLLFQQLDYFVREGNVTTLGSVAWILRTYIQEFKGRASTWSTTLLGSKSKHAKRPIDVDNPEIDSGLDKSQGKKDFQGSGFFTIFAELLFPLVKQFKVLASFCPLDKNFGTSTLSKVKSELIAANTLLVVAKEEQIYVPTEDTPSLSHLSFMKILYNEFIQLNNFLPEICIEVVSRHAQAQWSKEAQVLLLAVVNQVILGIGCILELDYRVLENDLQSIWRLLLFATSLQSSIGEKQKKAMNVAETAVNLASSVMQIFGELRQVDSPLFSLCSFLRQLMITEQAPPLSFGAKLQCKALMSTYLSPKLLLTLASVIKEVPEGQLSSFVRLLKSDMEETLKQLEVRHKVRGHQMQQAGMKVLVEIYICILEHGNVTALNSIQVGMSLRALMDVIVYPSLGYLVDSTVRGGDIQENFLSLANMENRTENMSCCSLEDEENQSYKVSISASQSDISIVLLLWEYIMRLYMSVKILHRQCISLMPQKQARRACTAINDPTMLFLLGEATHADSFVPKEGYFSCIKKGNVSIFKFLHSIEEWLQETGHQNVDSFQYTLDCIAVHSLADFKRQLNAVNYFLNQTRQPVFLMNECKEGEEDQSDFGAVEREMLNEVDRKKMQKVHKKLKREASSLASFLTWWMRNLDFNSKYSKDRGMSPKFGNEALVRVDIGWNKVVCSLNWQTLLVARWGLLCQNIDVWLELASEDDIIAFCRFMFGKTLLGDEQNSYKSLSCTVYSITSSLLESDIFYEQQGIRGVFLETLWQEVVESLSLSKANIAINSSLQYIEGQVCNAQEIFGKECGIFTKGQLIGIEQLEEIASILFNCDSRELAKCVLTINLVSRAPVGYIKASSVSTFISNITKLESCVVVWLLTCRKRLLDADELCSTIECSKLLGGLELLLASRRSIESLLLQEGSLDCTFKGAHIITALLYDSQSMYWPVLSLHAVATCFDKFFDGLSDDAFLVSGKNLLFSYLKCTTGVFTFFSQRFFKEFFNHLLLRNGNEQVSSLNRVDLDDSLEPLMTTLVAQLKKSFEFIKSVTCMEEPIRKERFFGVFASLGAVGSLLWSITETLELLDEKCHLDKGGNTKWSGGLPGKLLSWIQKVERFVIDSLHNILLTDRLACSETIRVDCSLDDNELLVLQDREVEYRKLKPSPQNGQKHLASASFDVNMEAFQELADHDDQEFESDNHDIDANEDSDTDEVNERESNFGENSYMEKLPEKEILVEKISTPNLGEQQLTSTQVFGDFVQMSDVQVSMIKVMLLGRQETLSWLAGELFMAMAAIVKLKSLFHSPNVTNLVAGELINRDWSSSLALHVGAANTILQEAAKVPQLNGFSHLILLPGVIKYLESFGSFLPYTRPTLSPAAFVKLVNSQMVLLGAVLSRSQANNCLGSSEELKCCLQSCFNMLVKKPLGLHFHLALQSIERNLLGFQDRISSSSMQPNSPLLGGIDCLVLLLDAVSGPKRLQILSKYCSRYLAAVFNLIVTFQSSWNKQNQSRDAVNLTSSNAHNAAILVWKCVEILVTISSREVIFPMKASHVAQAMSCPAVLFRPFYQINLQKEKFLQNIFAASEIFGLTEYNALIMDGRMLLSDIYIACCKLLRNLLRHRKRESGHCVALLGESVRALLFFLEVMELATSTRKVTNDKSTQCMTECASWLKRVYEEVAEHRETLGSYVVHMLSDYICIISGFGMSIKGLSREVEATLRMGVYALVDICSTEDLQQLHAVLGEGPRRTVLTDLRHDYEKHFKYTGKV